MNMDTAVQAGAVGVGAGALVVITSAGREFSLIHSVLATVIAYGFYLRCPGARKSLVLAYACAMVAVSLVYIGIPLATGLPIRGPVTPFIFFEGDETGLVGVISKRETYAKGDYICWKDVGNADKRICGTLSGESGPLLITTMNTFVGVGRVIGRLEYTVPALFFFAPLRFIGSVEHFLVALLFSVAYAVAILSILSVQMLILLWRIGEQRRARLAHPHPPPLEPPPSSSLPSSPGTASAQPTTTSGPGPTPTTSASPGECSPRSRRSEDGSPSSSPTGTGQTTTLIPTRPSLEAQQSPSSTTSGTTT